MAGTEHSAPIPWVHTPEPDAQAVLWLREAIDRDRSNDPIRAIAAALITQGYLGVAVRDSAHIRRVCALEEIHAPHRLSDGTPCDGRTAPDER